MKANELRIGNWYKWDTIECELSLTDFHNMEFENDIVFQPIPLTEEWLLNFGFETYTTEKSKVYKLGNFMVTYVLKGRFAGNKYLKAFNISFSEFGHIKHVHTLQNLYFALTGEELQIKK